MWSVFLLQIFHNQTRLRSHASFGEGNKKPRPANMRGRGLCALQFGERKNDMGKVYINPLR